VGTRLMDTPERKPVERSRKTEPECVADCMANTECSAAVSDSEGACAQFLGYTVVADQDMPDFTALDGLTFSGAYPHSVVERERRLLGDSRPRTSGSAATSEHTPGWAGRSSGGITNGRLYRRRATATPNRSLIGAGPWAPPRRRSTPGVYASAA
jgi:hypothetical protein